MKGRIARFYEALAEPLIPWTRILLLRALLPLAWGATQRLWTIEFFAPQYPKGLELHVYSYSISGGNEGVDLTEINTLNHYVGMQAFSNSDAPEMALWGPTIALALVLVALATLIVASLLDTTDLAFARTRNLMREQQAHAYARGLETWALDGLRRDRLAAGVRAVGGEAGTDLPESTHGRQAGLTGVAR